MQTADYKHVWADWNTSDQLDGQWQNDHYIYSLSLPPAEQ